MLKMPLKLCAFCVANCLHNCPVCILLLITGHSLNWFLSNWKNNVNSCLTLLMYVFLHCNSNQCLKAKPNKRFSECRRHA